MEYDFQKEKIFPLLKLHDFLKKKTERKLQCLGQIQNKNSYFSYKMDHSNVPLYITCPSYIFPTLCHAFTYFLYLGLYHLSLFVPCGMLNFHRIYLHITLFSTATNKLCKFIWHLKNTIETIYVILLCSRTKWNNGSFLNWIYSNFMQA